MGLAYQDRDQYTRSSWRQDIPYQRRWSGHDHG